MNGKIRCPKCMGVLLEGRGSARCGSCGEGYPVVEGVPVLLGTKKERETTIKRYLEIDKVLLKETMKEYKARSDTGKEFAGLEKYLKYYRDGIAYEMVPYLKKKAGLKSGTVREEIVEIKSLESDAYGGLSKEFDKGNRKDLRIVNGKLANITYDKVREAYVSLALERLEANGIRISSALEVGCGNMQNAKLVDGMLGAEYYGFDYNLSRVMIGRMLEGEKWNVWCGDGTSIALEDKSVDLSFTMHVMERMGAALPRMAVEMGRVSKYLMCFEPGYEYQLNMFGRMHNRLFDYPVRVKEMLLGAGMEIIEERNTRTGDMQNIPGFILAKCGADGKN